MGASRSLIICAARDGQGPGTCCGSLGARDSSRSESYQPYASVVDTPNPGISNTIQCGGKSARGYISSPRPRPSAVPPDRKNGTSEPMCAAISVSCDGL